MQKLEFSYNVVEIKKKKPFQGEKNYFWKSMAVPPNVNIRADLGILLIRIYLRKMKT